MLIFNIITKTILTIFFWSIASIGGTTAFIVLLMNPLRCFDHDFITYNIETYMAGLIYYVMTKTHIWTVTIILSPSSRNSQCDSDNHNRVDVADIYPPMIIAPNHVSIVDTLFVALLPHKKTYSYNKKWGWIPIFGWMSQMAGYISIDKSNPKTLAQIVPNIVKKINQGYSIMMYPEGSRNRHPEKLSKVIKTGAFRIAKESGKSILPIVFINTDKAMSRYGIINYANITIHILEPIKVEDRNFEDVSEQFRNSAPGTVSIPETSNGIINHNIMVAMNKYRTVINQVLSQYY